MIKIENSVEIVSFPSSNLFKYYLFQIVKNANLVAPVAAKMAVRIKTPAWIARLEDSSIVAINMKVLTTAMNDSQKSKNCNNINYIYLCTYVIYLSVLGERYISWRIKKLM